MVIRGLLAQSLIDRNKKLVKIINRVQDEIKSLILSDDCDESPLVVPLTHELFVSEL